MDNIEYEYSARIIPKNKQKKSVKLEKKKSARGQRVYKRKIGADSPIGMTQGGTRDEHSMDDGMIFSTHTRAEGVKSHIYGGARRKTLIEDDARLQILNASKMIIYSICVPSPSRRRNWQDSPSVTTGSSGVRRLFTSSASRRNCSWTHRV